MNNSQNTQINWSQFHQPIVLGKGQWKSNNDLKRSGYLLGTELERAYDLVEEFYGLHKNWLENKNKEKEIFNIPMNLAIIGERGSGKTSLLISLKNKLEDEGYFVFDIIDPNTLSSEINILEIIITQIYQQICDVEIEDLYLKEEIISLLKRIMATLSVKRQKEFFFKKDHPSIDVLDKINDLVGLDNLIIQLFEKFQKIQQRKENHPIKELVVIIDDLDLIDHQYINKLVSEIFEFLNAKLIIVLAYHNQQLEEAMLSDKIKKNKNLLKQHQIEIKALINQIDRLLFKMLPSDHRIYLYEQTELLKKSYIEIFNSIKLSSEERAANGLNISEGGSNEENDGKEKDIDLEEWIYIKIQEMTGLYIKPVDDKETVKLFLPMSLREFIQLSEILAKSLSKENAKINEYEKRIDNLKRFKKYLQWKVQSILPPKAIDMLDNWSFVGSHQKNYLCFHYFLNQFDEKWKENNRAKWNGYPFDLHTAENHNLRLGDIYEIMEQYKTNQAKMPIDFFVVYIMKVLYSIELSILVNLGINSIAQSDNQDDSLAEKIKKVKGAEEYLDLINTSFMPADYNYFNSIKARSDKAYEFIYNEKDHNADFIKEYIACVVPNRGDVKKGIKDNSTFRYRKIYSYLKDDFIPGDKRAAMNFLKNNKTYIIDYFVLFGKADYYLESLAEIYKLEQNNSEQNKEINFIFFSMFQIDCFVRLNYTRRSEDNKYNYAIGRLNNYLTSMWGEEDKSGKRIIKQAKKDRRYFLSQANNKRKLKYKKVYTVDMKSFNSLIGTGNEDEFLELNFIIEFKTEKKKISLSFEDLDEAKYALKQLEDDEIKALLPDDVKKEMTNLKKSFALSRGSLTDNAKTCIGNIINLLNQAGPEITVEVE